MLSILLLTVLGMLIIDGCDVHSNCPTEQLKYYAKTGDSKVTVTILAPVISLPDDSIGTDCEVFYNGTVRHPEKIGFDIKRLP